VVQLLDFPPAFLVHGRRCASEYHLFSLDYCAVAGIKFSAIDPAAQTVKQAGTTTAVTSS
jgi:hypothetical protein